MTRSKDLGTMAETAVVKYARLNGYPNAERRALRGNKDVGDILLAPGLIVEVKGGKTAENASDNQVIKWLKEVDVEKAHADAEFPTATYGVTGLLVVKRKGVGYARAGEWWSVEWVSCEAGKIPTWQRLKDTLLDLRYSGYGDMPDGL